MHASQVANYVNSREPFVGPLVADTLPARRIQLVGQESQYTTRRLMRQAGRYPVALGAVGTPSGPAADPSYADGDINRMEDADDTYGSGVFDQPGREPTANVNLGVFASSYSLPGFVSREIPFTVSRDISDATDNAAVVMVPGGGLQYAEHGGRLVPYPTVGPTPRPGGRQPPRSGSTREDTYVSLQSPTPRPTLNQGVPVRTPGDFRPFQPPRDNRTWVSPVPEQWQRSLPVPQGRRVSSTSIVQPHGAGIAVGPMRRTSVAGFGEATSGPSLAQWLVAGALVGAGIGIAVTIAKKGK